MVHILQGDSNIGYWAARFLHDRGGIIRAFGDNTTCVLDTTDRGINMATLATYLNNPTPRELSTYPDGLHISAGNVYSVPCDVFIPCRHNTFLTGAMHVTHPSTDLLIVNNKYCYNNENLR